MKDENKTQEQLMTELRELRQQIAESEASETERKRAEELLQRGKKEWETAFDAISDWISS